MIITLDFAKIAPSIAKLAAVPLIAPLASLATTITKALACPHALLELLTPQV